MGIALLIAVTYWAIFVVDESFSWQTLVRPIVTGPIVGLVLGDVKAGCIMGGLLEAVYMGIVSVGGGAPADAFGATIICTTFVINGGLSNEAALALALPIGTLTARLGQLDVPMHAYFVQLFDKYIEKGDTKKFCTLQRCYRLFTRTFKILVIFLAVWIGADNVQLVFDYLPAFILDGLTVAGGLLPAVGLGILTSMIFNKQQGAWLFIGFALSAYLGLGTMAVAIIAGCAAVLTFFNDSEAQSHYAVENVARQDLEKEEDFFS
ncbi:PTS mannose/fructose/sorbose/N-acetylgalactosamine transporter subunit IIC [[Eubacterium] hominis]|uniref:PTS mannose/fructose/sorbose/N-acetylgalactosamine transporter subunit IIC n=1 Tax=[Eubacterium] hominis TaxID=2764325 RepID=UPI003A4DA620